MSETRARPNVHLVGSVGLDSVDDVLQAARIVAPYLKRVPDGEVGGRKAWISWQYPLLRSASFLQPDPAGAVRPINRLPMLTLADDAKPDDMNFGELGYAREARASYQDFCAARDRGELSADARFQVSLPTPFAVISAMLLPHVQTRVEAIYERAILDEIDALCRHIPHRDLCIQWDLCTEMIVWDGQKRPETIQPNEPAERFPERMERLCKAIPDDVETGLHLCYGDFGGRHFIEPQDAAKMVSFANALSQRISRKLAYIHMPVPIARSDDAFHRPLRDLKLQPGTELYLGLVHAKDGVDGAKARIAAAQRHAPAFGIATECGMGRMRSKETVHALLKIHADVCATLG
ncbi:MAG: hypothetical protein AB7K04_02440 [Pseudorhodoplanes sp.]